MVDTPGPRGGCGLGQNVYGVSLRETHEKSQWSRPILAFGHTLNSHPPCTCKASLVFSPAGGPRGMIISREKSTGHRNDWVALRSQGVEPQPSCGCTSSHCHSEDTLSQLPLSSHGCCPASSLPPSCLATVPVSGLDTKHLFLVGEDRDP